MCTSFCEMFQPNWGKFHYFQFGCVLCAQYPVVDRTLLCQQSSTRDECMMYSECKFSGVAFSLSFAKWGSFFHRFAKTECYSTTTTTTAAVIPIHRYRRTACPCAIRESRNKCTEVRTNGGRCAKQNERKKYHKRRRVEKELLHFNSDILIISGFLTWKTFCFFSLFFCCFPFPLL